MKYTWMATAAALGLFATVSLNAVAQGAPAQAASQTVGAAGATQPPVGYPQALILIRSSLAALEQADETGDYDVLYALSADGFKKSNPVTRLRQTFAPLKAYNLNSVLVLEPQFTQVPALTQNGMMTMSGFFVSGAYHINFQLLYIPEDKHWKLFGVSAGVVPSPKP